MTENSAIVIVGAGQAGSQVAASLRTTGNRQPIILIGDEEALPYQRPPLSKAYLEGKGDPRLIQLRPEKFYIDQNIDLRRGIRAVAIDRAARRVLLEGGAGIPYGHLVLAPGARNRPLCVPGNDLGGIHQLRSVADADRLALEIDAARHVAVVGAGLIGLEFAALAAARGKSVTIIEATDRAMARSISAEMAALCQARHEAEGIEFRFGCAVTAFRGADGHVSHVDFGAGGEIATDLVLIGIGVIPNVELAQASGLVVNEGIVVDEVLTTSDQAISAIGDCARFPSPFAGGAVIRLECVQNAVDQAKCVAGKLNGAAGRYVSLPWFWSDQGKLRLQMAGLAMPHERALVRHGEDGATVLCFGGGRLIGVETLNRAGDHMAARKILSNRWVVTEAEASRPDFDLRAFIKAREAA